MDDHVAQLQRQIEDMQSAMDNATLAHEMHLKDAYLKVCKAVKVEKPENVNTLDEIRQWTQTELRNLVKKSAVNENKVSELKVEVDDLQKQLVEEQNARGVVVKLLQDQLSAQMTEIEELRQERAEGMNTRSEDFDKQKRMERIEAENEELRMKMIELEKKLKDLSDSCNELDRVVKDKADLMQQLADVERDHKKIVTDLQDQLNAKLHTKSSEDFERELNEMRQVVTQIEQSKLVLQKRLQQSEEEKVALRGKVNELEEMQKKNCNEPINDLDGVVKKKNADIARLNQEMNALISDRQMIVKSFEDQMRAKTAEIEQLRRQTHDAHGNAKCNIQ